MGLGGSEMVIILVIILLLFGGKKITELMKGLGKGVKEFKDASKGAEENVLEKKTNRHFYIKQILLLHQGGFCFYI